MADNFFDIRRGLSLGPQTSAPSNPANGDLYYDSTRGSYSFYNNGNWIDLASRSDVAGATTLNSTELTASITQSSLVRITGSTNASLYGLAASAGGRSIVLYNFSTGDVTLYNQNAGEPVAANRIATAGAANVIVQSGEAVQLTYDDAQSAWIISSGSGGGGSTGAASEVALASGISTISPTFIVPRTNTNYGIIAQIVNTTDVTPEFMPVTITNKTNTGFTAVWNSPTPTANYALDYIVGPGVAEQTGEALLSNGATSATITIPIPYSSTFYVVIAEMVNYVDSTVQFQPITVTNKSTSSFQVQWNAPVVSGNYRISWQIATYQ